MGDDTTTGNLGYGVRLNLDTSFTGTNRLRTRLQARNNARYDRPTRTPMSRTNFDGDGDSQITLDIKENKDNATSVHVEALYRIQVSDFISVTLGVYMMTNMDHNKNNGTTVVGVWRTSFTL